MCNEWYWRKVNGVWLWVRGNRPVGAPQPSKRGPQGELFGVFPDRMGPVIAKGADGEPEWREMRWGLRQIASWARQASPADATDYLAFQGL